MGICAILALLVFIVFGQTLRYQFVNYDDEYYVYKNPEVIAGLTPVGVTRAFTRLDGGLWTPLVTVSHMLDCQVYGLKAGGHHFTNLLLHLASTILLFLILREMTGAFWRCAFVAALFAIHPLNVESVAWISERKDVLSGLFFMLTLAVYLRYARRPDSWTWYLAVVLLFTLGLMCKPMLVTAPFVLLLLDYWPLNRLFQPAPAGIGPGTRFSLNWRVVVEKAPLLALACGLSLGTLLAPKQSVHSSELVPFLTRMGEAPGWLVIYICQMIRPSGLALIYTHSEESLAWWPAALALLGSITLGTFLLRRKHPYLWMGWLWNLVMLVPVSGIVQISRHARADHYNYLPQIGLYVGLTWLAAGWAADRKRRRVALGALGVAVLLALLVVACKQASYWRDSETLWTHVIDCTKDNLFAHNYLAIALIDQGRTEEGIVQAREALKINPGFSDAHDNLGKALLDQGRTEDGIAQYREALRINPDFALAHFNLGIALCQQGRMEEGIAHFREALRIDPGYADARNNLGIALCQQGRAEEGITQYREALRINPASAEARYNLGAALFQQGRAGEAIGEVGKALELQPSSLVIENYLAWILATAPQASLRDGARAVQLAGQAARSTGGSNPVMLRTLAAAYAEAGDFSNAVRAAEAAIHLAETQSNSQLAEALRREAKLYAARRPYEDAR